MDYKIIIEKFLLGKLSQDEKEQFLHLKENDPIFDQLIKDYTYTFQALKRSWVKDSLNSYKSADLTHKIITYSAIGIIALVSIFALIGKFNREDSKNKETNFVDSTFINQNNSNDSIDSIESIQDKFINYISPIQKSNSDSILQTLPPVVENPHHFNPLSSVPFQEFFIDNTKDNTLTLKGGTVIKIYAGTLETDNNRDQLNDVHLKIKEFTGYYDLWQEGLHTCSHNDRLISGGSCYIEAETKGEKVNVRPGASYTILFPGTPDEKMKVFYGKKTEDNQFDWTEGETDIDIQTPSNNSLSNGGKNDKIKLNLIDTIWFMEPNIMDEGKINGNYTFNTLSNAGCFENVFSPLCSTAYIPIKSMLINKQKLVLRFHLDSNGYFDRYDYSFIMPKKAEKELKRAANSLIGNTKVDLKNHVIEERIVNVTLVPKFRTENRDSLLTDSNLTKLKNFNQDNRIYNAIVASKFGYINCDHFTLEEKLIDMTIHSQMGALQDVRVFFKSDYSVMNSTIFDNGAKCSNIPLNAEVLVIGISRDGKRMFVKETKTDQLLESGPGETFDALKIKNLLMGYRNDEMIE